MFVACINFNPEMHFVQDDNGREIVQDSEAQHVVMPGHVSVFYLYVSQ